MWAFDLSWRNMMNHLALTFMWLKHLPVSAWLFDVLPTVEMGPEVRYDAAKDKGMTGGRHRVDFC